MTRTFVSVLAVTAFLGLPAFAQTAQHAPASNPASTAHPMANNTAQTSAGQLKTALKKAGVTQENDVQGTVIEAQTSGGQPVFVVVGPASLNSSAPPNFGKKDFLQNLSKTGLKDVKVIDSAHLVHGQVQGSAGNTDAVLAVSGLRFQAASSKGNGSFDQNQFQKALNSAGIKADTPFKGQLVRAQGPSGPVFMIVGDEDLIAQKSDKPVQVDAAKLRSEFQTAGLKDFTVLNNAHVFQGTTGDTTVFVVAGQGLAS
ncbi:MAG: hypothetical protein AB7F35_30980 [Acetobacteraceae bacterium]